MTAPFVRRRWLDFRNGHTLYLVFLMGFANFILIFHRLFIERVPFLEDVFSNLWVFAIFFVVVYVPAAVLVGFWHKRTQMKVEMEVLMRQNPFFAKWFRVIIDILSEKSSPEEVENLRKLLKSIEEGKGEHENKS